MGILEDILGSIEKSLPQNPNQRSPIPSPTPAPNWPSERNERPPMPSPTGPSGPVARPDSQSEGMSPMAKVLLALLAIYAMKNLKREPSSQSTNFPSPTGTGGLGDLLKGPLGGLIAGLGGGILLNGGLDKLLKQLKDSGLAAASDSWVGTGPNKQISEGDLARALGSDTLDQLAAVTGMRRDDLLNGLSRYLPAFIDQLTPDGRLPNDKEWQRML